MVQETSCKGDRRVLRPVGGGHAAFRMVHASQLSSAVQMTPRYGLKSVRMNPPSAHPTQQPPPTIWRVSEASWLHMLTEISQKHQDQ